jgi:hypothetical protein
VFPWLWRKRMRPVLLAGAALLKLNWIARRSRPSDLVTAPLICKGSVSDTSLSRHLFVLLSPQALNVSSDVFAVATHHPLG